ncbi:MULTISPECIES: S8 family serine peptidase [Calothrix]|uniref:S8 family serine peptidase n=2 Tax=Calothrix TaxID=1186 RepID=A0ABR8AGU5_9CYAN|nr:MULTISPECIES: S8 family serine peptidase [Calothrix]MBD2198954.1 S8 family serine peptidase [Calothrix parietina FACHB-288]MBD2227656.1 S8 family serine peptidase [Calothrix anomala FACHB-343]
MNHSPIEPLSISGNYVSQIADGWNNNFTSSGIFTSNWQNYALPLNNATSNTPIANSQNINLTPQSIVVAVDRADLILQNAVIPSSASICSNIELKYKVKNQGTSNAIASTTKFYLSPDKTLSNDDKYLGYDAVNIIAAGVNTSESTTIKIDNSISPGSYYLISQADSDRVVNESNESNNIVVSAININPALADLKLQNVVSPSATVVGNSIHLKYQVTNQGSETAFSSYTLFYISKDKTVSDDDVYLGSDYVDTLMAGAYSSESARFQVPNNIATGSYYLILQADGNGDLPESNENNNIFTQAINITQTQVDLIVQKPVAPSVVTVADKFTISYQIKNQGVDKSLPTVTMFYLSQDKTLSQNDLYLGDTDVGSLVAGTYATKTSSLRIGKNIAAGSYYLLYKADGYNSVIETNESNNIVARSVTVKNNFSSINGYGLINAAAAVAQANGQNSFTDVPNLGGNNWGADLINVPEVWAKGYTGKGITVAVLDTGVDRNHVDLKANIWKNTQEIAGNGKDDDGNGYIDDVYGWNFAANNNNTLDKKGHGTHTAGIIAGVKNSFGVTGIAYDAKIMPVKVLDDNGSGTDKAIALGIRYAVNNGANVINLSVGKYLGNAEIKSAVQYASSKGAIVVMAAGNDGGSAPYYPANYAQNWGLAVGAVDRYGEIASFSNFAGSELIRYITAPGVSVYSTVPNNKYANWNGTSMATPHVAGVVALMLSANKNLTDAQVRKIVTATASNNLPV